jgi:hypothetical protein
MDNHPTANFAEKYRKTGQMKDNFHDTELSWLVSGNAAASGTFGMCTGGRADDNLPAMMVLAVSVPSVPHTGHATMEAIRPFTGSTSNS